MENKKILIEFSEAKGWKITVSDKYSDQMDHGEMLDLLIQITTPNNRPRLSWLKTKKEHDQFEKLLTKYSKEGDLNNLI